MTENKTGYLTDYFGITVNESYPNQVWDYIQGIDPYYRMALIIGVHLLSQDQNEPVQDHYFTAIHGTIMEMENVISNIRAQNSNDSKKQDWSIVEEKK